MIQQTTLQLVVQSVDRATAGLNAITARVDGVKARIEGATGAVSALRSSFVGLAVVAGAERVFRALVQNSVEAQKSMVELDAAIKRTGGAAGITTDQIAALAGEIQSTSRFADEAVQDAATRLTLFTNVTGKTFERALRVSADLAARMGTDVPQAAQQLGRALQAPGEGLRVLVQAGIKFNDEQIKTLQYMTETGRVAEAQGIILDELAKRTEGAAADSVKTLGGAFAQLGNQIGELVEAPGIITKVTEAVSGLASVLERIRNSDFAQGMKQGWAIVIEDAKTAAGVILNLAKIAVNPIDAIRGRGLFAPDDPVGARRSKTNRTGAGASIAFDPLAAANEERLRAEAAAKAAAEAAANPLDEIVTRGSKVQAETLAAMYERTMTYAEKEVRAYEAKLAEINQLRWAWVIDDEEALKRRTEAQQEFFDNSLGEIQVTAQKIGEALENPILKFTDTLKEGLQNAVRSSDFSMKNIVNNIIAALSQKALFNAIDKVGDALTKAMSGSGTGFLASAGRVVGSLFGFAGGGVASKNYIAGEEGPELITAGINSHRVFNKRQLQFAGAGASGGGAVQLHYAPVYNISGVETQAVMEHVERGRAQDTKGILKMLKDNGFGSMR